MLQGRTFVLMPATSDEAPDERRALLLSLQGLGIFIACGRIPRRED